jgi:hypothetical protein
MAPRMHAAIPDLVDETFRVECILGLAPAFPTPPRVAIVVDLRRGL